MKLGFYPTLALQGIYKNRKLYLPYLVTAICMVMMFYLFAFLSSDRNVAALNGGGSMQIVLSFGTYTIALFSLIFLFYTNSFLMRRRKTEFGLYNILGMGKQNITRILFWETLFLYLTAVAGGLLCGILFSKLSELVLVRLLDGATNFTATIAWSGAGGACLFYAVVFALILLKSLHQIRVSKPVELLRSENMGEKPPKANWITALLGLLLLVIAYGIAVTIQEPLSALRLFFYAVLMVITSTYLLFISGSVVLCKILQKKKNYYYQSRHFVSVSSMTYRMRRNGAGLASICILSTMVLVMISSTTCLYLGEEDVLKNRYPTDFTLKCRPDNPLYMDKIQNSIRETLENYQLQPENTMQYHYLLIPGYLEKDQLLLTSGSASPGAATGLSSTRYAIFIPLEDYNRLMNTRETLEENEVLFSSQLKYNYDTFSLEGHSPMKIKKKVSTPEKISFSLNSMVTDLFLILPDAQAMENLLSVRSEFQKEVSINTFYGFDVECSEENQIELYRYILNDLEPVLHSLSQSASEDTTGLSSPSTVSLQCSAEDRADFLGSYGGMFFLGIMLGSVFILSATLIMYYKQISEGYEDQARFAILQKVGMTKAEIKQSINSQVLTVFFLPLVMAGIHVIFAFPMISRLLNLFNMTNIRLFALITLGCYLIFSLFYVLIYLGTSRAYYHLVARKEQE